MLTEKLSHLDAEINLMHDFRNFLYYVFVEVLKYGEPDPIQYDIAYFMQHAEASSDGKIRQQVQAMRGCGKSVIAACYCCWLWYCNPDITILYLGSNQDLVDQSAKLIKDILDDAELLQHLRPQDEDQFTMRHGKKVKNLGQSINQTNQFDVRGRGPGRDASFAGRPVFGGWTGRHPDVFVADDCEIPENSLTELKRKRLMEKLLECESLCLEGSKILYMGTPQTEDSIYIKLHAMGYTIRRWPAELPDPDDFSLSENVSPWLLQRVADGERPGTPSYPERFGLEILRHKEAKSLAYYQLQMLLNPNLADEARFPLKLRNAIVLDVPFDMAPAQVVWGTMDRRVDIEHGAKKKDYWVGPASTSKEWLEYTSKLMYIDPKGGGADSVGYAVIGILNGMIFVLDAGGLAPGESGTSEATMKELANIARLYDIRRVIVESNWGGSKDESTYAKLMQPVMAEVNGPTAIELNWVTGQKEIRILDCLEPIFNCHRIIFTEKAARCEQLSHQIGRITRDRGSLDHDDVIDALYGAVAQFADQVVLDPGVRLEEHRQTEAKKVAQEFDDWAAAHTRYADGHAAPAKGTPRPRRQHRSIQTGRRWRRI